MGVCHWTPSVNFAAKHKKANTLKKEVTKWTLSVHHQKGGVEKNQVVSLLQCIYFGLGGRQTNWKTKIQFWDHISMRSPVGCSISTSPLPPPREIHKEEKRPRAFVEASCRKSSAPVGWTWMTQCTLLHHPLSRNQPQEMLQEIL